MTFTTLSFVIIAFKHKLVSTKIKWHFPDTWLR